MSRVNPRLHETLSSKSIQTAWMQLNARYFEGALPPIEIQWSRRLTTSAGMFISRVGPRARRNGVADTNPSRRLIRLSAPLLRDQSEQEIIGTLAHEMIHQWQFDILKRRPNHGPDFRRIMAVMNRDGMGITIRHTLDEAVQALAKYLWQCQQCGRDYQRHRRSIRPSLHCCGACRGPLKEIRVIADTRKKAKMKSSRPSVGPALAARARQLELPLTI